MDAETLKEQFVKAAAQFGYDDAETEVEPLDHLKVKWVRTGSGWIHLTISDYLLALTPEAAYDIADGLFRRITGEGVTAPYEERSSAELSSEGFARANQARFAERNGLDLSPPAWLEYMDLAKEQGVELPAAMRVYEAPEGYTGPDTYPTMRVAVYPRDMEPSGPDALAWMEMAAVKIGKGHCGFLKDAPDAYVDLAGVE